MSRPKHCPHCLETAFELYAARPTAENAHSLKNHTALWLMTRERAALGPSLAILEVIRDRGCLNKLQARIVLRGLRWMMVTKWADQPMWNDFWLTRWKLTRDRTAAEEIHQRAHHIRPAIGRLSDEVLNDPSRASQFNDPWAMVAFTAAWAERSQRSTDSALDAVLLEIEKTCANCLGPAVGRMVYMNDFNSKGRCWSTPEAEGPNVTGSGEYQL